MIYRKKRGTLKPHNSSIILNLEPILKMRNITHPTAYLMKIGINNTAAVKMLKGEAVQFNFRQLTTLCQHLNCTPNDLLETREMALPAGHALEALAPKESLMSVKEFLDGKSVEEVNALLSRVQ